MKDANQVVVMWRSGREWDGGIVHSPATRAFRGPRAIRLVAVEVALGVLAVPSGIRYETSHADSGIVGHREYVDHIS